MPHTIIHCGTAGEPTGERTIKIYTGSVMDYAVRFEPHEMKAYGVSERRIKAFETWYEKHRAELIKKLKTLGVPYYIHEPHAENLPPP